MFSAEYHRLLFLFVDGVGLAPAGPSNPLADHATPTLEDLLGGPLTLEQVGIGPERTLAALDACLGVEGLPQSATGQTTLFTGVNAAHHLGRHVTGFPGPRLRELIDLRSLFLQARRKGLRATFANAYSEPYLEAMRRGERRPSVTTCAVWAAELPLRGIEELEAGDAVTWDIERDLVNARLGTEFPLVTSRQAGRQLARLTGRHHLTVFESFLTDLAGHDRFGLTARESLSRLDGLLAGVLETLDPEVTLLLTSDHGNLEDSTTRSHSRNPVPLLAVGPLAPSFSKLSSIVEVTPRIMECLAPDSSARLHYS